MSAEPLEADGADDLKRLHVRPIALGDEEVAERLAHAGDGQLVRREKGLNRAEIGGAGGSNAECEKTRSHAGAAVSGAEKANAPADDLGGRTLLARLRAPRVGLEPTTTRLTVERSTN